MDEQSLDWDKELGSVFDSLDKEEQQETPVEQSAPNRDEKGRFASASVEADPVDQDAAQQNSELPTGDAVETPTEPVAPAVQAWKPSSWKQEELDGWDALPAHTRAAIERREAEINKGLQEAAQERQIARTINQIATPYQEQLRQVGTDPIRAFQESLAVFSQLNSGTPETRAAMIRNIAQRYGVPLAEQVGAEKQAIDPALSATQQQLAALERQMQQWRYTQQQAEQQQALSQVEEFGKDAAHPHYESVRATMADLIQSGTAKGLQDAYDKAMWLVPEVRAKLVMEMEQKRQQDAAKRAAQAKKSAAVNTSAKGAPAAQPARAKSWAEDLGRIYDEVSATH